MLGGISLAAAILVSRSSRSHVVTIALMLFSLAATLRYGWWRLHLIYNYFTDESNARLNLGSVLMLVLISAELYTTLIMVLGYVQTSWPLHRKPIPLPTDEDAWPHVDVLIPTYNEALALVRYTALAAINIDYPPEKLHVYILDDGTREDFRKFSEEAGVGYITREKHNHAKAGNINHALTTMNSPYVAIFDCDHVPTRSFLQVTLGWFLVEDKLAMLQTPHHFYSPDPFERNLLQYTTIPNEAELFYGIIQDGNDFWNATFFCGSCAVIRRSALNEVGGIATETVTEDAHTSLRMQKRGWNTAYINIAQAAGLATETLAAHVGQRVRWARGMIQILRTDNPLLARGMKWTQRLCYFNAMIHFMYAVPRLVFLCAPLAYMLFGLTIIPGYWVAILAYALPHLIISSMANSRIQGRHRHSFWNEIYETVLAPYILLPTLLALINPKLGKFNVTDKGTTLSETEFDRSIARPTTWLLGLNFLGLCVAPYRLFVLDPEHPGTVIANLFWIVFNMVILGVAAAVAHEQKQRRASVRIHARIPVVGELSDGRVITGVTRDMSVGGASAVFSDPAIVFAAGESIRVAFPQQTGDAQLDCLVVGIVKGEVRLKFRLKTIAEQETLTRALYSRADSWVGDRSHIEVDRPLLSLLRVMRLSLTGFHQVLLGLLPKKRRAVSHAVVHPMVMLVLGASLCFGTRILGQGTAAGAGATADSTAASAAVVDKSSVKTTLTLNDMGVERVAEMRGPHSYYSVHFALAHTQLPRTASLGLTYHFDRSLAMHAGSAPGGTIQVRLNNTPLGTIRAPEHGQDEGEFGFVRMAVPADLLIRDNDLTFEFSGGGGLGAGSGKASALPLAEIGASSELQIASDPIPFKLDLGLLPLPLFDSALQTTTTIPFVFLTQPDAKTLEAAGIVASWFGILGSAKPVRFTVSVGQIPTGNAVLFVDSSSILPASMHIPVGGPTLSIKANPNDATGAVLVLAGEDDDQLLTVARTLSLLRGIPDVAANESTGENTGEGDTMRLKDFVMPPERKPDDAPRWLPTDRLVSLLNYSAQSTMQSDGTKPLPLYFRVAPDLYYGENQTLALHLSYRYNSEPVAPGSALRLFINGLLVNETPLLPGKGMESRQREVLVPVASLRPFANTMVFHFDFNPKASARAQDTAAMKLEGEILRNSALDLRGLAHWVAMPDLELFANAGFPFTQRADLGETTVIMPVHPAAEEIALLLHMMSHCGRQTGYPVLRVEIQAPNDVMREDRDYLILGTVENQPTFAAVADSLPVRFDRSGLQIVQHTGQFQTITERVRRWLNPSAREQDPPMMEGMPAAVVEGMQSPLAPGRSMVVIALRDKASEASFSDAFDRRSQSSDMAGSVSLLDGDHFASYDAQTAGYHIGTISNYTLMRIWLTRYFILLVVVVMLLSLLLAKWVREYLRNRAEERVKIHRSGTMAGGD